MIEVPHEFGDPFFDFFDFRAWSILLHHFALHFGHLAHGGQQPESIPLVWYFNAGDWNGGPILWRPHQSACAAMLALNDRVRLVPFDSAAYAAWLGDKADSSEHRAMWATIAQKTR